MTTSGRFSPSRARGGGGGPKLLDLARSKHKVTVSKVARQENGEGEYTACGFVGETIWALWGGCERGFASASWCYVRKGGIIFEFANGVVLRATAEAENENKVRETKLVGLGSL